MMSEAGNDCQDDEGDSNARKRQCLPGSMSTTLHITQGSASQAGQEHALFAHNEEGGRHVSLLFKTTNEKCWYDDSASHEKHENVSPHCKGQERT